MWKGHAVANLLIVKGDTATVHLDFYTLKKIVQEIRITRTVEIDWEFDRLAQVPE
jgi:hypothetical protein